MEFSYLFMIIGLGFDIVGAILIVRELLKREKVWQFFHSDKKLNQIKKTESVLRSLFPNEMKICDEEIKNLKSHAKEKIKIRKNAKKMGLGM